MNLALLWWLYLSLSIVCQLFLGFQWDVLLLETGLLAIFYAPWVRRDSFPRLDRPRKDAGRRAPAGRPEGNGVAASSSNDVLMRWMVSLLLFKLIFLSGITKILSGDAAWAGWTALEYHYQTQPLPTWTAWYVHQLPTWVDKSSLVFMWAAELLVPFAFLAPVRWRRMRLSAVVVTILFQLSLIATGNYTFFNWLTILLCVPLVDDQTWRVLTGHRVWRGRHASSQTLTQSRLKRLSCRAFVAVTIPLSGLVFIEEMARTAGWMQVQTWLRVTRPVTTLVQPFRSVNGYGLFRVMTTRRPEIVMEVSPDGETWLEYPFRWKVGNVHHRPRFVAPHQPRLDWQMWFAGLNPAGNEEWLLNLVRRLLEDVPEVRLLLGPSPLDEGQAPQYVKLAYYDYRFTRHGEDPSGAWWTRRRLGDLTPTLSRESFPE